MRIQKFWKKVRDCGPNYSPVEWFLTTREATRGRGIVVGRPIQIIGGERWSLSILYNKRSTTFREFKEESDA